MILNDYLKPDKTVDIRDIPIQGLAHVGDAVFELMVRTWLCTSGTSTARKLHDKAVTYVSAKAQAAAADRIIPELTEEESAVYKRGRNKHVNTVPKASTLGEYHAATGIEALFGYLYMCGNIQRLNELFEIIIEVKD